MNESSEQDSLVSEILRRRETSRDVFEQDGGRSLFDRCVIVYIQNPIEWANLVEVLEPGEAEEVRRVADDAKGEKASANPSDGTNHESESTREDTPEGAYDESALAEDFAKLVAVDWKIALEPSWIDFLARTKNDNPKLFGQLEDVLRNVRRINVVRPYITARSVEFLAVKRTAERQKKYESQGRIDVAEWSLKQTGDEQASYVLEGPSGRGVEWTDLLNYQQFKRRFVEVMRVLPAHTAADHEDIVAGWLAREMTYVALPEEATRAGALREALERLTEDVAVIDDPEAVADLPNGIVLVRKGHHVISLAGITMRLREKGGKCTERDVAEQLHLLGWTPRRLRVAVGGKAPRAWIRPIPGEPGEQLPLTKEPVEM